MSFQPDLSRQLFPTKRGDFQVRPVSFQEGRDFIEEHHYAKGCHNGPTALYGLWDHTFLLGVIAFATPVSENVRASVFGPAHKSRITELHRLVLLDWVPHNAESFFISRALHRLKDDRPDLWSVVSFADTTHGHVGTVYQATNAFWCGTASGSTAYRDKTGRIRHRRQCGKTITHQEAERLGWEKIKTGPKHRYLLNLPDDRRHARQLREMLQLAPQWPYPKLGYTRGNVQ